MAHSILQLGLLFDDIDFILLAAGLLEEEEDDKFKTGFRFNFNNFHPEECWQMLRFKKDDLVLLTELLNIPNEVRLPNRSVFAGLDALCITLYRLSYPCRLTDLRKVFGRSKSELSKIITWTVTHILHNFGHLLDDLNKPWLVGDSLERMANRIQDKGCPLERCWGFIDGTVVPICRPGEYQRHLFSGHKRLHCLKYQSIVTPNGLIVSLKGPYIGRRHDAGMFQESGVLQQLLQKVDANGNLYYIYGDAAYPISPCVITPFKGANVTPEQHHFNQVMSSVRISVEWAFGDITRTFAFTDFKKNLKLFLQPIDAIYKAAVIFVNCRACLYGNQTSEYFQMEPPSIQEYLA